LQGRIEHREVFAKQCDDFRESVTGGCHGLHNIAGVKRMVISVVTDEMTVFGIGREESNPIGSG
jgi:hypothetical protein